MNKDIDFLTRPPDYGGSTYHHQVVNSENELLLDKEVSNYTDPDFVVEVGHEILYNGHTPTSATIVNEGLYSEEEGQIIPSRSAESTSAVFHEGKLQRSNLSTSGSSLNSIASISSTRTTVSSTSSKAVQRGYRKYLGICLTLSSGLLYSLAALIAKLLKDDYHPFMLSIWRFQGVFLPSLSLILFRACFTENRDFRAVWPLTDKGKGMAFFILMLRGILGCWSVILQFYSLQHLQVADSMVITSSTSVFVTLLAHCFIGEKCALVPIFTAILTFTGVFVISRPPLLTGKEKFDTNILIGVGMALGCMLLSAFILVIQRYLRNVHFSLISMSSGVWGTAQCLLLAFYFQVFRLPVRTQDTLYGLGLAGLTFFAQSFIVIALKFEQAGPVAVVQSCDVIFAFMWQFAFLGVVPDLFSLIGSMIIISGVLLTAFRKWLSLLPGDHETRRRFRYILM